MPTMYSTLEYLFCIATIYADVIIFFETQRRFLLILASNTEFARYTSAFVPNVRKHQVSVFDLIANRACLGFWESTISTYAHFTIELEAVEI